MRTILLPAALAALVLASSGALAIQNFDDDDYHELVIFNWDTTSLDVLIVPPAAPATAARLVAVEKSIDAWEEGIDTLGAPWFADALSIQRYTLGSDDVPEDALADPEIFVISGEPWFGVAAGIGANSQYLTCQIIDLALQDAGLQMGVPKPGVSPEWHSHATSTWAVGTGACWENTQDYCFVVNTGWFADPRGQHLMYDLNAHEFGHCLGIGHVGDALDYKSRSFPKTDIMSYQFYQPNVHCVSSLNLRAMEGSFAQLLGRPESEWRSLFEYVHMTQAEYVQMPCENP